MKTVIVLVVSGIALFLIAYVVVGLLVHAIVGDKVYGSNDITIGARVEWIKVKDTPYTTTEPLQPAYNITKL